MFSKEKVTRAIMLSMDNFGAWLLKTLEEKNLSQSDLARSAGISRGTLSNIISGARGRGPDSLKAIARALRLPQEQVFREAGLFDTKPGSDPWVEEQAHKLSLIPASRRGIAGSFIETLIDEEEVPQKKPSTKRKSSTARP